MKFAKVKTALQDILTNLTFAYVTTDKGVLRYDGENENDLAVGVSVQSYDTETETESPVEDGEYKLEDGRTLIIKDGVIEEIREVEENLDGDEPQEGEPTEGGDDPVDPEPNPDPEPEPTPDPEPETEEEEVVESGRTVEAEEEVENPSNEGEESDTEAVVKLREEVNELYKVVDELKARLEKLEGKPAAEPAANEFKNMIKKSGNDKLDNFINKYCK